MDYLHHNCISLLLLSNTASPPSLSFSIPTLPSTSEVSHVECVGRMELRPSTKQASHFSQYGEGLMVQGRISSVPIRLKHREHIITIISTIAKIMGNKDHHRSLPINPLSVYTPSYPMVSWKGVDETSSDEHPLLFPFNKKEASSTTWRQT